MHRREAASNEPLDFGVTGQCHIVIKSKECKNKTTEHVRRRIDSHILKEDTICTYRCTDTAVEDVSLKGADNATDNLKKRFLVSKLICPYQYRDTAPLCRGR